MKSFFDRCQLFSEVWYGLQQMNAENATMRHILENYQRRFRETEKQLISSSNFSSEQIDQLHKQTEVFLLVYYYHMSIIIHFL